MKNFEELCNYLNEYGYLRIHKNKLELDLNGITNIEGFIIFKSGADIFWIVKESKYLNLEIIDSNIDLLNSNIELSLINSYGYLEENCSDIAYSLGLFTQFIGTKDVLLINYIFKYIQFDFDLLYEKYNLSFIINEMDLKDKIIETKNIIYIIHNQAEEKSNLYYKYAYLKRKTTKEIRTIGFRLNHLSLELREYEYFENNFKLHKSINFKLNNFMIEKSAFINEVSKMGTINSFEIFPQADNFNLIWRIFDTLNERVYKRKELWNIIEKISNGIVERQISYYLSAMLYLNLLREPEDGIYALTIPVIRIKEKSLQEQIEFLSISILKHKIFNESFKEYLKLGEIPEKKDIVSIIDEFYPFKLKESTAFRRSSTVRVWLNWIINNLY